MKPWSALRILLTLTLVFCSSVALADESTKTKARQHFKQGVELFDQRRFGDALAEFEQSYTIFPDYGTLYNVGQVQVALGHPVEAILAFEKFLVQGGASIPAEQRKRVEAELKLQRERAGDVKVTVAPDGADVRIDGDSIGMSPLASEVRIAVGHHRVEAMLEGYRTAQSEFDVVGQGHVELMLKLEPLTPVPASPEASTTTSAPPPTPDKIVQLPASTEKAQATPAPATSPPNDRHSGSTTGNVQRVVGYSLAAAGLIGTGVGIAFAADGQSKHNDALSQWAAGDKNNARATESASNNEKTRGYVVIGVGGGVLLTGAILLITAPSNNSNNARLSWSPWLGTSTAGATVRGIW